MFPNARIPTSQDQKTEIIRLLQEGVDALEIAQEVGVTPQTVRAIKAHITMGTYGISADAKEDAEETGQEVADAIQASFGLERDLQLALRSNIEQLEEGLRIVDGQKERIVPSGRIDITAEDREGRTVVIELKVGAADRDAIGQILSYIGDLSQPGKSVRGILVAADFPQRIVSAARAVPALQLRKYGFHFTFATVSCEASQL